MRVRQLLGEPGAAACVALLVGWALAGPAQAQIYQLYLNCEGMVAAGPGATSAADAGVTPRGVPAPAPAVAEDPSDKGGDKNRRDENIQARARAVKSAAKRGNAHLELALRDNNMTALVQRSNVLPTGERLKYAATQTHYTANFAPQMASAAYRDWRGEGWIFSWYPPFQKMAAARFAIDRQTGVLEGEIVGQAGEVLGLIDMQCEPRKAGEGPAPRF